MASITIKVEENLNDALLLPAERLVENPDPETMLAIYDDLKARCDPYVPMLNGPLSETAWSLPDGVHYVQVYARYQYYGVNFRHTLEYHPQATAKWNEAMMREHGDEFKQEVKDIIKGEWKHGR